MFRSWPLPPPPSPETCAGGEEAERLRKCYSWQRASALSPGSTLWWGGDGRVTEGFFVIRALALSPESCAGWLETEGFLKGYGLNYLSVCFVSQEHVLVGWRRKGYWCLQQWPEPVLHQVYQLYMLLVVYLLPLTFMTCTYVSICRRLWQVRYQRASIRAEQWVTFSDGIAADVGNGDGVVAVVW